MTDYIPQTSASDRYAAAREALDRLSRMPLRHEVVLIDEPVRRHAYIKGYEIAVEEMRAELDTLRALITPPGVHESAAETARRLTNEVVTYAQAEGLTERGIAMAGIRYGFNAGIQYAHERWEPADRPTQEQMLRWLEINCTIHAGNIFIPEQYIEREEASP